MSHSELPHSSGTARAGTADTQSLIGLLESLVPHLLRLQSQTWAQNFPLPPPDPALQTALLDHQAAVIFTEDILTDALRNVSSYLEVNAERYPGLAPLVAITTQATEALAARDYAQSFALILQVYRAVTALRLIKRDLPPIRGQGSSSSVH